MILWLIIYTIVKGRIGKFVMKMAFKFHQLYFYPVILIIIFSCSDPNKEESVFPLSDPEFTFHQDENKLYFGIQVDPEYKGRAVDNVFVYWYGTNPPENTDGVNQIVLNDSGIAGDIIIGDKLFARKILNNNSNVSIVLDSIDTGDVYIEYSVYYEEDPGRLSLIDTVKLGNIIPSIVSINAKDTIARPAGTGIILETIGATVFDANGLETIRWVGFNSFHIERNLMMNNGDYIFLYDDGSEVILYEPNFTSGDDSAGDGTFTFKIPIYGVQSDTNSDFHTKPGTYRWRFSAQDFSNGYSQVVEHEIIIE